MVVGGIVSCRRDSNITGGAWKVVEPLGDSCNWSCGYVVANCWKVTGAFDIAWAGRLRENRGMICVSCRRG